MSQIMTGPKGMVVYHSGEQEVPLAFPTLNVPSLAFARFGGFAANANHQPNDVINLRQHRRGAAITRFGWPGPRKV